MSVEPSNDEYNACLTKSFDELFEQYCEGGYSAEQAEELAWKDIQGSINLWEQSLVDSNTYLQSEQYGLDLAITHHDNDPFYIPEDRD